jgi:hypothetical protein
MSRNQNGQSSKTTTDHDEIRKWVEKNGGSPARVKATGRGKNDPGILRIDYPGFSGEDSLVKMDWDEWFEAFDANKLAFVYQPTTRFSKLVSRRTAASKTRSSRGTARRSATAGRRTGAKKTAAARSKSTTRRRTAAKKRASARPAKRTTKRASKRGNTRSRA